VQRLTIGAEFLDLGELRVCEFLSVAVSATI
jgi:hypothetical protein